MDERELHILHGMTEIAGQNSYAVLGLREIGLQTAVCNTANSS